MVDESDYELLQCSSWSFSNSGYAIATINQCHVLMHRLIMKPSSHYFVDHIDGNKLNNCRHNLRIVTNAQNIRNQKLHCNNTSGYKGVVYRKEKKKYAAYISPNRKQIHLGYYNNIHDAALAYNNAAIKYFGEYANLNIVRGLHQ